VLAAIQPVNLERNHFHQVQNAPANGIVAKDGEIKSVPCSVERHAKMPLHLLPRVAIE